MSSAVQTVGLLNDGPLCMHTL